MNKYIIRYTHLLMLIALVFVLFSCDTKTTVDLGTPDQRLVVEGRIELLPDATDQVHEISLSVIGDFFNNEETPRATGADVWITTGSNVRYDFTESDDGLYANSTLMPVLNETYTLHIIWNGQEYAAVETLIPGPPIDSIYQRFEEGNLFEDEGIKIAIDFTDPENEENYYFWETYLDGELQILPDPGNKNNIIGNDEFFDGNQIEGYSPNSEIIFEPGDQVMVKQLSLSKNAYDYYFILFDQAGKTGALIDTPPIPVRGNIVNLTNSANYALGYFYAGQTYEALHVIE